MNNPNYDPEQLQRLDEALGQLKDQTRMKIVLLLKSNPLPLCVGKIAEVLQIEKTLCAFHLRKLAQAKILIVQNQGRNSYYFYDLTTAQAIVAALCNILLPEQCSETK